MYKAQTRVGLIRTETRKQLPAVETPQNIQTAILIFYATRGDQGPAVVSGGDHVKIA